MTTSANSSVDICNLALLKIGGESIGSIDITQKNLSKTAIRMALLYDNQRILLLEKHNWEFARKRKQIAAKTARPLFGYAYCYPLPNDYVRMFNVPGNVSVYHAGTKVDYIIENGNILIGNRNYEVAATDGTPSPLDIIYVRNEINVNKFSQHFIEYLATVLAKEMAYSSTLKLPLVKALKDFALTAGLNAASYTGQMNPTRRVERSSMIAAHRNIATNSNGKDYIDFRS